MAWALQTLDLTCLGESRLSDRGDNLAYNGYSLVKREDNLVRERL